MVADILDTPLKSFPASSSASRSFRLCIPDAWYRRSRSRSNSSASVGPSEDTFRRLEDLQESDDESEEGDGTAKQKEPPLQTAGAGTTDWRSSISQNRLSSMFDSWIHPSTSVGSVSIPREKKVVSVSEPKLVAQHTGGSFTSEPVSDLSSIDSDASVDGTEFEEMLVSILFDQSRRNPLIEASRTLWV